MMQSSETVSAMAVRCACTAIHLKKFLYRDKEMESKVRHDLQATAKLLEAVCSELEEFQRMRGNNAPGRSDRKSRPRSLDSSVSDRWHPMTIVPAKKRAPVPA
jgi:hypothetical protein